MDQDKLERLAAILGNNESGYRDSAATEAAELSQIIKHVRPDLYELMIAEERRELARSAETNALVSVKKERARYHTIPDLSNYISLQEDGQTLLYIGQVTKLKLDLTEEEVRGNPIFTKYIVTEREGWYVQP